MDSIYETFRSYSGVLALLPEHQARLQRSCMVLEVDAPDLQALVGDVQGDERFKCSVFADGRVELSRQDLPEWHGSFLYPEVWKVKQVQGAREQAEVKHGDISFQREARAAAMAEGYDEILMVDEEGLVREGGITNVFFVSGDGLVTPASGVLPGIARELVIRACAALGVKCELREVSVDELADFDGMFMTNSVRGLVATGPILPVMQRVIDWCTEFLLGRVDEGTFAGLAQAQK